MTGISRRSALFSAGLLSLFGPKRAEAADFELIGLGRQFDAVAAKLDRAIEHCLNIDWSDLEDFGRVVDKIVVTPATTIDGLCVKARVGCWGLLGDLDDPGEETPAGERIPPFITLHCALRAKLGCDLDHTMRRQAGCRKITLAGQGELPIEPLVEPINAHGMGRMSALGHTRTLRPVRPM